MPSWRGTNMTDTRAGPPLLRCIWEDRPSSYISCIYFCIICLLRKNAFSHSLLAGIIKHLNSTSTTDLLWDRVSDTSHWHQEQSSQLAISTNQKPDQGINQPIRGQNSRCVASVWVISSISGIKSKNQWRHAPTWHRHLFPNIWYSMIE